MDKLESLSQLRDYTQELNVYKHKVISETENLEQIDTLLDRISFEKQQLQEERKQLWQQFLQIKQDFSELERWSVQLRQLKSDAQKQIEEFKELQFEPLKLKVDQLRVEHGLSALPDIQTEMESASMAYLQKRREEWKNIEDHQDFSKKKKKKN